MAFLPTLTFGNENVSNCLPARHYRREGYPTKGKFSKTGFKIWPSGASWASCKVWRWNIFWTFWVVTHLQKFSANNWLTHEPNTGSSNTIISSELVSSPYKQAENHGNRKLMLMLRYFAKIDAGNMERKFRIFWGLKKCWCHDISIKREGYTSAQRPQQKNCHQQSPKINRYLKFQN